MFILIDKPKGITSHDVVDKVRDMVGVRKVGHAGTLDPMATGLVMVAIGRPSTKKLGKLIQKDKVYVAQIVLGKETDTLDAEGEFLDPKQGTSGSIQITKTKLQKVLGSFVGEIEQVPPKYSAVKIRGQKAYELARKGKNVKLKPRPVKIFDINLLDFQYPNIKIRTKVSSGTYIRSLARDIGNKLGCGAYLKNLRRTDIDSFNIKDSVAPSKLTKDNWRDYLVELR